MEHVTWRPEIGQVFRIYVGSGAQGRFKTAVSQTDGTDVAISTQELPTERFVKGRSIG